MLKASELLTKPRRQPICSESTNWSREQSHHGPTNYENPQLYDGPRKTRRNRRDVYLNPPIEPAATIVSQVHKRGSYHPDRVMASSHQDYGFSTIKHPREQLSAILTFNGTSISILSPSVWIISPVPDVTRIRFRCVSNFHSVFLVSPK